MLRRVIQFLPGFLTGLLFSGILLLLIAGPRGEPLVIEPRPTPAPLTVHVAGCVQSSGVYELPSYAIVEDAISVAGGPCEEAILDAVNLAEEIHDGQRIYLPCEAETPPPEQSAIEQPHGARININTATAAELDLLPGIGPSLAESIISFREANGPFSSVEQLEEVRGIGPSKLAELEGLVSVE